ncbi:HAMP domain-containing sensor histidine kinase [Nonomuraea sp. NPDC005650]|uniref:sensor histidine kinase n=1 Tax=Nonomuraea sp. NPDC005650 TaxID=3157045 RepID=UPI0033BF8338
MNLSDNWLILLCPLVTLLIWTAVAKGLTHLRAGHSAEAGRPDPVGWTDRLRAGVVQETDDPAGAPRTDPMTGLMTGPMGGGNVRRHPLSLPMRNRWGPRSLRGQITLLVAVVAAAVAVLTLLTVGVGTRLVASAGTVQGQPSAARGRAASATQGRAAVAAQSGAGAALWSPSHDHGRSLRPRAPRTPAYAAASRAVAVDARRPPPGRTRSGSLPLIVGLETAELIALAGWNTWKVTGRLLRPLEAVRAELALIDFSDLPVRIPEPEYAQEISRLCRMINNVLGRLHQAKKELEEIAHRQRQFAFDVSHELRNPIAGLLTQLEVARQDPGPARLPEVLGRTLDQVERLQTITDDMLCLARVRTYAPAERQQLDLAALVQTEISRRADRLPVRLNLAHGTTVTAVPSQIGRLLANLLDNAQRHSTHLVRVEVFATEDAVELAVSDDGPGIPMDDRERVFHRFTRLDDGRRLDRNGTGLGLAIARDIAHAHHGTLGVEESVAGGACFVLRLPRVRSCEMGSS